MNKRITKKAIINRIIGKIDQEIKYEYPTSIHIDHLNNIPAEKLVRVVPKGNDNWLVFLEGTDPEENDPLKISIIEFNEAYVTAKTKEEALQKGADVLREFMQDMIIYWHGIEI